MYKWIQEEGLEDAVIQGRNARLDFAESKLDQNINNGDTTAIIFLLKTLGKERGYVERQENKTDVKVSGIKPIEWVTSKNVED